MSEWIKYTGDNPPTDTSRGLHMWWMRSVENYWSPGWNPVWLGNGLVAYKYHDPYVEPEPEMPDVVWVSGWALPDGEGHWVREEIIHGSGRNRYRRCVEMTTRIDADRSRHCGLCDELMADGDHFCPRCGAEVKR